MEGVAALEEQQCAGVEFEPYQVRVASCQGQLQAVQVIAGIAAQTTDVFKVATGLGRLQQDRGYEMRLVEVPGLFVTLAHDGVVDAG